MFTETSIFGSHFQQQWNKHDMLSIAVAFQAIVPIVFVHCI